MFNVQYTPWGPSLCACMVDVGSHSYIGALGRLGTGAREAVD